MLQILCDIIRTLTMCVYCLLAKNVVRTVQEQGEYCRAVAWPAAILHRGISRQRTRRLYSTFSTFVQV